MSKISDLLLQIKRLPISPGWEMQDENEDEDTNRSSDDLAQSDNDEAGQKAKESIGIDWYFYLPKSQIL